MVDGIREIPRYYIIIISLLPLILNNFFTTYIIISIISLEEFIKDSVYYIYTYGPILWSIYHISLFLLVWYFIKREKGTLREVVGGLRGALTSSIMIVIFLTLFSIFWFQVVQSTLVKLIFGAEYEKWFIHSFKKISFNTFLYTVTVTSLTAGVCEEIIWRGYLRQG